MAKTSNLNISQFAEEKTNRGLLFQQEGKLEEAISFYRQVIAVEPNISLVHYNLGIALHHQGDLPGAGTHYRQALALNPDDIQALYNLGVALQQQGLLELAINHYQQVINLSLPQDLIKVKAYSNWGGILVGQGKFDDAREIFEKALALQPEDATLYNNLGQAFLEAGNIEGAIATYQQALELQPELIVARHNIGKAYQKKGLHSEAIAYFQQVIERQPNNIFANSDCGFSFMEEGKLLEAMASFQKVIKNNPFVEVYCERAKELSTEDSLEKAKVACALFLEAINSHDFERESPVGQASRLSPVEQASCLSPVEQASCLSPVEQASCLSPVEQASCLSTVEQASPLSPVEQASRLSTKQKFADYLGLTYYHLGNVSFEYGEYQQAEAYYKKALKNQPLNVELHQALGRSLAKQNRIKAAITVCHFCLAIQPDNYAIYEELDTLLKKPLKKQNNLEESFKQPRATGTINVCKLEQMQDRQDARPTVDGEEEWQMQDRQDARPTVDGEEEWQMQDRQDARPTLSKGDKFECKGLNCQPCLQRIYKSFQPIHIGHNVYAFSQQNLPASSEWETLILTGKMPVLQEGETSSFVKVLSNGRAWIVPQKNSWMICNAVAIINEENQLLAEVSREYPGQLPGCQNYDLSKHRIFSQEELPPLEKIEGTVAVLSGLSGNVYFHWMVDILPRLEILRRNGINFEEIDWFLINSYQQEFQRKTLRVLGIPEEKIIESDRHPHIQANKLIVPSYPGDLGWLPRWALEFHRREFLFPTLRLNKQESLIPVPPRSFGRLGGDKKLQTNSQPSIPDPSSYPERIYISRNRARYRRVLNEEEVISLLSKYGFATIVPESIPWEEQIALFANAKAIVSPHGSGLTNIMFCQPGTKVIELFSPHYIRHYYWVISQQLELEHYYLKGEGFPCYPIRELMYPNPLTEDILVNLNYLKEMLKKTGIIELDSTSEKVASNSQIDRPPVPIFIREANGYRTASYKNMQSKVNPTEAAAHYNDRAQLFLKQKKFDEAKAACEQALKNQPDFAPACKTMGNLLQAQGQGDAAWEWYSKAVEIQPDFAEAITNMGALYAQRQQWEEAIAYFQKAIAIKPDLTPAHRNLARAYEKTGRGAAAAESKQQALSLEGQAGETPIRGSTIPPLSRGDRNGEAVSLQQQLESQERPSHLPLKGKSESNSNNSAIALPTDALLAYKQLGQMLQSQGKVEEAWQWYRKAIALSPNDPEIYLNLGILYARQQQWNDAIKCYKKSIKLKPNFAEGYRRLATALTQVGQQEKAAECWYRAYSIEPEKATAEEHLILGNTLLRQNLVNRAISCYCHAIELNPNLKGAYENLGEAIARQGKQYQEQNRLGFGFQEEFGGQTIPQEILQKAEQLKQSASNLMMYEVPGMDNSPIIKPGDKRQDASSTANIVRDALKHFDRMVNELVNSVAFAFNLKNDVSLSYLESSLPIQGSKNHLLSPRIYYPEKPEFQIQYPSGNGQQPLVTVEPNLSETYWVGGMKSDLELGMEPEIPPALEKPEESPGRWNSPESLQWQPLKSGASVKPAAPGLKGETSINLAELHVQRASAYCAQGAVEQAIAECQKAIAMKPDMAAAYSILGNAFQQSGNLAEAEKNYSQAIALDPNDAKVRANLGNLYAEEKKWSRAIPYYQQAIALKPNFAGAYRNLAKAWTQVGKSAEAADCWYQAYTLEPQQITAKQYFNLGNSLYRLGQLSQAVWCYGKAIELNPNYAPAYHNFGSALKRQGKLDESAFYYQKAEELNGGPLVSKKKKVPAKTNEPEQKASLNGSSKVKVNPEDVITSSVETNRQDAYSTSQLKVRAENNESLLEKARGCLKQRQFEEAIAAGELAIKIQPQAEAYLIMGQAWQEMDRAEEAIGCYEKAIELNPDLRDGYQGLVWALQQVGQGEEAEELSYKALMEHPNWFTAEEFCTLAKGYLAQGKTEKSFACYRQAIQLNSQLWEASEGLGQISSSQQQWEEAVGYYRRAVELNNKSIGSYYGLGQALAEKGELEEAIACYEKVIELDGNLGERHPEEEIEMWEVYNRLADALQEVGRIEEAVEAYRRAIAIAEN
ncbi:MAG: tetratricopeptide repeat protein [Cyanobacteriota bacterium]|nr:tetratricopeptide repeat protein [Cyanobacteriota bacterium]